MELSIHLWVSTMLISELNDREGMLFQYLFTPTPPCHSLDKSSSPLHAGLPRLLYLTVKTAYEIMQQFRHMAHRRAESLEILISVQLLPKSLILSVSHIKEAQLSHVSPKIFTDSNISEKHPFQSPFSSICSCYGAPHSYKSSLLSIR